MDNEKPVVSVITVVRNGEKYLQQTISSVIEQDFSSKEYIIVDGGSTDGTLAIIKKNEDKLDRWISEPDDGIFDAMNKGLALSRGEWIWYINSDDFLEEGILRRVFVDNLNKLKGKEILYGNIRRFGEGYSYIVKKRNLKNLKKNITFSHPSTLVKKEIMEKIGGFNPDYKIIADYDLFCRLSKTNPVIFYSNEVFSSMREGGASGKLLNTLIRMRERFAVDRSLIGSGAAVKNMLVYLVPGFLKKLFIVVLMKVGMKKLIVSYYKKKYGYSQ